MIPTMTDLPEGLRVGRLSAAEITVILTGIVTITVAVYTMTAGNSANQAIAQNLREFREVIGTKIEAMDKRDDAASAAAQSIDARLTRIEAQLNYLATANGQRR